MIHYIILSCLLSLIGGAIYFGFLKKRLSVLHAKYTLLAVIALSWCIPFLAPSLPNYTTALQNEYLFDYSNYNQWNVVDIKDEKLVACYSQAATSAEQCHCEIEQQSNVLLYQSNPYYNFWIMCKAPLFWFFAIVMGLFLLDLLLKTTCLIILVISSPKEKRRLANTTFYLLQPSYNLPLAISSFTLWRHYVVFNPDLESKFTEEELEAILLHEVAHLRQRDTWQQFLLYTLRLFWWMQPMYYSFRKELAALNEYVADDFAVQHIGNAKQYAKTLIKAKEMQIQHEKMSLAMAFAKSLFKQRILRVIETPTSHRNHTTWAALAAVVVIFWSTSAVALPILQQHDITIKQYEILQQQSETTGKVSFCKSCLVDELKKRK